MRRSRIGGNRALYQRLVFVAIALAFVGSGYLIGRYILASLLQKTPAGHPVSNPDPSGGIPSGNTAVQVQTPELTVYRIQIGAFSSKETADKLVSGALSHGVGAYTMAPDPLYKVYCGITGSKNAAERIAADAGEKLAGTVMGKTEKPYVGTLDVPSHTFTLEGTKAQVDILEDAFTKISNGIFGLMGFWDGLHTGEASSVDLSAMEQDLKNVKTSLGGMVPEESLKAQYDNAVALTDSLVAAVSKAKEASGGNGKVAPGMAAFMETIDSFIALTKD